MKTNRNSQNEDVLLIGGGIIGVCSAYYLAQQGLAVTLIEKGEICSGSSHGNAGLICPSHSTPLCAPGVLSQGLKWMLDPESPFYIKPRPDLALLPWILRFAAHCTPRAAERGTDLFRQMHLASLALYKDLIQREGLSCHFAQSGALTIYNSAEGIESGRREAEKLQELGAPVRIIDAAEAKALAPNIHHGVVGGLYNSEDAHVDPALLVKELARVASEVGVQILPQTELLGCDSANGRINTVRTTRGDLFPKQVVLTAGAWSTQIARDLHLQLPMQPAKGYSITVERPENYPEIHLHLGETRVVATPMGPHLRFAGTLELAGFDFTINQRRVDAILRAANSYLTNVAGSEVVEIWRGMRPLPPDGLPYIGRSPQIANLVIATGHSSLGLSLGAITGKLVQQLVCEEAPDLDLHMLRVNRHRV